MKLRLLSLIFPSNYPNFAADSIYVFNRILIDNLKKLHPDIEIAVAGPAAMPSFDSPVSFHSFQTGVNKFQVRFGFPWKQMARVLTALRPDIILVNMPEQAGAISVLTRDELRLPCRIISYVHYVPATIGRDAEKRPTVAYERSMNNHGNGQLLVLRLLEGLLASDLVLVASSFGVRLLRDLGALHLGNQVQLPPITALPPPVDPHESAPALSAEPAATPCFAYNHRLYDEYGTWLIFSLLQDATAQCSIPFEVLVTNPTAGRAAERHRLNTKVDENLRRVRELPFVRLQHFSNRATYFEALGRAWGGIAPYKLNALWSMSVFDLLAAGRPVLSFDIASFREMGLLEEHLVTSTPDFIDRLERLSSKPLDDKDRKRLRGIALRYSGRRTAERFLALVNQLRT